LTDSKLEVSAWYFLQFGALFAGRGPGPVCRSSAGHRPLVSRRVHTYI